MFGLANAFVEVDTAMAFDVRRSHKNKTMAAKSVSTSIAGELYQKMNPYRYKEYCSTINERDSVSINFYKASKWVNYFALDTGLTFRNGKVNNDHVFEYFGSFNGVNAKEVRKNLLSYVSGNMEFVEKRSTICLSMRSMDLDTWIDNINGGKPCDELALLILSAMYHRHSLVVTKNRTWCSIESPTPMNLLQAMSACTVRLLYLGDLAFGVLKWKPQVPKPVVAKPHLGELKIVEEYTLNEQSSSFKKLAVVKPTPVETSSYGEQSSVSAGPSDPAKKHLHVPDVSTESSAVIAKQTGPKVVYAADNQDFYVETSASENESVPGIDSPVSYPWKKKLCVSVRKLSDFEISYWTGGSKLNSDEYPVKLETEPDDVPVWEPTSIRSRSHLKDKPSANAIKPEPSGDRTTEELLAHAKSLIKRAQRASKSLSTSDELKTKSNTLVSGRPEAAKGTFGQPSTSRRGQIDVETSRNIKCQMCEYTCTSVTALSDHHQNDHGISKCSACGKAFSSKSSLDKHMYVHKIQKTFVCEECGQGFLFQSRLLQHQITHSKESRFVCNQGSCNKSFKNKGDLNRHVGTHTDKWYFCAKCSYKNKDKRNRDSHSRTHESEGEERYHCEKCGKRMRFSTQMKRHRETGCDLSTLNV